MVAAGWCASSSARRRRRRREARAARGKPSGSTSGARTSARAGSRMGRRDGRRLVERGRTRARAAPILALNEELHKEVRTAEAVPAARAERGGAARRPAVDLDALRRDAVEATKADTCRLARRQARRCARLERALRVAAEVLDSTATHRALRENDAAAAAAAWAVDVFDPARRRRELPGRGRERGGVLRAGVSGGDGETPSRRSLPFVARQKTRASRVAGVPGGDVCDRTVRGEAERRAHFQGRRHLKRVAAARKRARGGARRARARFRRRRAGRSESRIEPGIA